jgi:hypothetical protein
VAVLQFWISAKDEFSRRVAIYQSLPETFIVQAARIENDIR